ncbi:MAG: cytochrome C oxidase subunit IV family protein [Motiliproteus sp.]|nr:cytochrome C oxidase subunit IV family protein [Motiliproteus sp.]MCW9051201.1 cytochrome C oxidase subunit IV family protein [Motiliproteus sp.]
MKEHYSLPSRWLAGKSGYQVLDYVWWALMALTLASAWLAESAEPSLVVTLFVAVTIGLKGRLVVDRFMELKNAHQGIRFAMNLYFYLLPLVVVLVYLFPEFLADLTKLSR